MKSILRRELMCLECPINEKTLSGDRIITRNGVKLFIRGVSEQDEDRIVALYKSLSEDDRNSRFLKPVSTDKAIELGLSSSSVKSPDVVYDILIANENGEAVAHGGFVIDSDKPELFCVVKSSYRNNGLGNRVVEELMTVALAAGYSGIDANTLFDNYSMKKILKNKDGTSHPVCDCMAWELELSQTGDIPVMCGLDGLARYCKSVH